VFALKILSKFLWELDGARWILSQEFLVAGPVGLLSTLEGVNRIPVDSESFQFEHGEALAFFDLVINVEEAPLEDTVSHRVWDRVQHNSEVKRVVQPTDHVIFKSDVDIFNPHLHILEQDIHQVLKIQCLAPFVFL